ncbi:MAG TPA: hypothetical protein VHP83_07830 [Aggregatilineaceae bacterium]|nr:hypothetical protein [Aggregatilineaceae bacterium]
MTRVAYEDVDVPVIVQQVGGDLRLRGRGGGDLVAEGDALRVERIGNGQPYLVRCGGDCRLTVPTEVTVVVQQVGGDAKITDIGGDLEVGAVGGDLTLRGIHAAQVKTVGGDLRVKWAEGNVTVEAVGADATVREVAGAVWIAAVGSDLYLRNIEGGCVVERVGSDLVLNVEFKPGLDYRFNASKDILCRIQPGMNVRFELPLDSKVALDIDAQMAETEENGHQVVTFGDGSAVVHVEDCVELRLVGEEDGYVFDLGIQIEEQVEARLSNLEERLSQQLDGLDEKIQARAQQFASQAERWAENAQKQAEHATERFRRSMDRQKEKRKRGPRDFSGWEARPPAPPTKPHDPVTEEERLMILRMVQEKKISIEEAERLLAALERQE